MKKCVIYQEIEAQGFAQGFAQSLEEKRQEIALNLVREGINVYFIANVTNLTVKKVQQLQQNQQSNP
ncbi:hypothetical protein NIES2101_36565 [Calothrix sp. HK-06]|nr:hypothetical protein NIES2101_36565 [Calothrix sp. HK-06]